MAEEINEDFEVLICVGDVELSRCRGVKDSAVAGD